MGNTICSIPEDITLLLVILLKLRKLRKPWTGTQRHLDGSFAK
jgi:hypothetical protein